MDIDTSGACCKAGDKCEQDQDLSGKEVRLTRLTPDICTIVTNLILHAYDDLASSHLLTGLEVSGMKELRKRGFEGNHPVMVTPAQLCWLVP